MNLRHACSTLFCLLTVLVFSNQSNAIGHPQIVFATPQVGGFSIVDQGRSTAILVDPEDHPGVIRAVGDLQSDIKRVTGTTSQILQRSDARPGEAIIIGTIGKSKLIDQLVIRKKIDVSGVAGKWESFLIQVVRNPLPGVTKALVIAGSDKRGTIYGIYELSEQMGVSPWYWWADVPVEHKDALYVKPGAFIQGPPAVKYRGIFLNDEAPSLTGWVKAKYGNYNHQFYERVFELLLRLRANYLWPAMWDNAFNEDDPLNPKLADEYGIVMGTSHHEPMLRAQQEWKRHGSGPWDYSKNSEILRSFWDEGVTRNKDYESIITLGMRGDGDMPMSEGANIALLEKIVADQRKIIAERVNPDLKSVPQDWALYKEVQEYYEKGMRVPDDVTLLWCDDNWGNIRRLPTPEERKRSGGAGIYYHFDYVGGPRSYKWLNTIPITKIWEQMNLAYQYDARRIWIVNVGDLKPMEFPIEFFLTFAWDPNQWPKEKLSDFTRLWAEREFGPAHASEIADIVSKYTKYNGWRKPELLEPDTFSLVNYQEAEKAVESFRAITTKAEAIYNELPADKRDSFFELVLYPTKASATVFELYVTAGENRLYAAQRRASTNDLAQRARDLFKADGDFSGFYNHSLAGGKWNHMMDQTHIGYTYWNQPEVNRMPDVLDIQVPVEPKMAIAVEGSPDAWPAQFLQPPPEFNVNRPPTQPSLPQFDVFNRQRRWIDVFNRGNTPFEYSATASVPWILVSDPQGRVDKERRLWVTIDWDKAPQGQQEGSVKIAGPGTAPVEVKLAAFKPQTPTSSSLEGFVEANGYVSIEAEHYTNKVDSASARWEKIPDYGRTLSSMSIFPVTAASVTPPQDSPRLEYKMYLFDAGKVEVEAIIAPTLNFVPGRGLRFAVSFDDQPPQIVDALADNSLKAWEKSVEDSVRKVVSTHTLATPGFHTLKIWMVDPGVVLQKLIVNFGGEKPSYFGPPESYRSESGRP
jgi:Glycosyl hydrolase family 115/Gylcosyl hydrolase family 115 C-terminal domain